MSVSDGEVPGLEGRRLRSWTCCISGSSLPVHDPSPLQNQRAQVLADLGSPHQPLSNLRTPKWLLLKEAQC